MALCFEVLVVDFDEELGAKSLQNVDAASQNVEFEAFYVYFDEVNAVDVEWLDEAVEWCDHDGVGVWLFGAALVAGNNAVFACIESIDFADLEALDFFAESFVDEGDSFFEDSVEGEVLLAALAVFWVWLEADDASFFADKSGTIEGDFAYVCADINDGVACFDEVVEVVFGFVFEAEVDAPIDEIADV